MKKIYCSRYVRFEEKGQEALERLFLREYLIEDEEERKAYKKQMGSNLRKILKTDSMLTIAEMVHKVTGEKHIFVVIFPVRSTDDSIYQVHQDEIGMYIEVEDESLIIQDKIDYFKEIKIIADKLL